ncbi:MAG: hypothetical protein Q8M83_04615 [bacterium]|nr:hypothetical protein [bacterium]
MKVKKIKIQKIFLLALGALFFVAVFFVFISAARADYTACSSYDYCAIDKEGGTKNYCLETDCPGEIGRLQSVAYCGAENTQTVCTDGLDNDNDTKTDCADTQCASQSFCKENTDTACKDGKDNDGDGEPDCLDEDCAGKGGCADWYNTTECMGGTLPIWSPEPAELLVPAPNGTVTVTQTSKIYANKSHFIKIAAPADYTSFTLTIGNATDNEKYFPYDSSRCIFSGSGAENLVMIYDATGRVLQIINQTGTSVSNFNLTLVCPAAGVVVGQNFSYPIAIDAKRSTDGGEEIENGEQVFSTMALESVPPEIDKIEVVGLQGDEVKVPYNSPLYMRVVPKGQEASGLCGCDFWTGSSPDCEPINDMTCQKGLSQTCLLHLASQTQDVSAYYARARAEDGAGNFSDYVPDPAMQFKLNVVPIVKPNSPMSFDKEYPFYIPNEDVAVYSPVFQTALESTFNSCQVKVDIDAGDASIYPGPGTNEASCEGVFNAPQERGEHYVSFTTTDNEGDLVTTGQMVFFVCPPGDTDPPCDKADFDQDGVPDRSFVNNFSCDNCVNLYNPDQVDSNNNHIGDMCEYALHCKENLQVVCSGSQPADLAYYGTCKECCFAGTCSGSGALCCSDDNCGAGGVCQKDFLPWLETKAGDIYGGPVGSAQMKPAPPGYYNATFCILSSGEVTNFSSENKCVSKNISSLNILSSPITGNVNLYSKNVLARLDLTGLKNERYGQVVPIISNPDTGEITQSAESIPIALAGQVYTYQGNLIQGDLIMEGNFTFDNSSSESEAKGSGLIFVQGNLYINGNWTYGGPQIDNQDSLASLGVVVVDNPASPDKTEGNIYFNGNVTQAVGIFYAEDTIYTGASDQILKINGALAARNFAFERTLLSETEGAEQIIYDGRAQINPPPGLADFFKSLPVIRRVVP